MPENGMSTISALTNGSPDKHKTVVRNSQHPTAAAAAAAAAAAEATYLARVRVAVDKLATTWERAF